MFAILYKTRIISFLLCIFKHCSCTLPVIISLNDKQNNPFLNSTDQINMKNAKDYLDSNGYMKQSIDIGNEYNFSAKNSLKLFSNSDLKYLLCEIADSIN